MRLVSSPQLFFCAPRLLGMCGLMGMVACTTPTPAPAPAPASAPGAGSATAPASGSAATAEAPMAEGSVGVELAAALPCDLVQGEEGIENLRLQSADGACVMLAPFALAVGTYPVRASAGEQQVSLELRGPDGMLYATDGTLTVESRDGATLTGRFEAEDQSPPAVGRVRGTVQVTLGAP